MADKYDYNQGIPDQAAPDAEKMTMEYGNDVANFIANEWFFNNSGVARFYDTREEFERLRLYARGSQSTAKYKRELAVDGDLSYLNLDWEPVPIIPKFVDLVVNKKQERTFDVVASAMDEVSITRKKDDLKSLKAEMEKKEQLMALQEMSGVEVFKNDPNTLPKDKEELDIYMSLNYKQQAEIAAETTINQVLMSNNYDTLKKRMTRDLTEIGIAVAKHDFDPQKGVTVEYVDPTDLIYSYTEDPDFRDVYYYGEVKRITIADLLQMFPNITPEQMVKIRQAGASFYDTHGISYDQVQSEDDELRESNKVEVMFFSWKATRKVVHKIRTNRKGGKTAVKRDDTFEGPKTADAMFEKTVRQEEVVYQGVKVLGDDSLLLKWELQKNMIRPKSSDVEVKMPYIVSAPNFYKGRYDSIVKRITKYADLIQILHLKIQQVIQKVVPPGLYINADGLAELDMGDGSFYSPREALKMFFSTGSVVGRSMTQDGDPNSGSVPIQELPGSQGVQLQSLIQSQQYYLEQMRMVTGVNEAIDASTPHPDTAVGVNEQQVINSNVATRGILDAIVSISSRLCDAITLRMQDVFEYHPLAENFKRAIGRANAAIIDGLDDLHLRDFGIFIQLEPDDKEKAYLDALLNQAIANQMIHYDDAALVRGIKNVKLANQVLAHRRKLKAEEDAQIAQQNATAQAEAQGQAAQVAEEAKMKTEQMKAESQIQIDANKSQLKIQEYEAEMQKEKQILLLKHELELDILGANMAHEDEQNRIAAQGSPGKGVSVKNKLNTVDGRIDSPGYIGGH